jgi:peroxiredoxin Q/BCP
MLKVGETVPDFAAQHVGGGTVTHSDLRGVRSVVYFYPKDDTPGCTIEAKDFTAKQAEFDALGVRVYGVSKDSVASHCRFRDKHGLTVALLSDPSCAMQRAFGAFGEKLMYGKKVEGTLRSTFVVGPDGRIAHAWPAVKVAGHVDAVLAALRAG